MWGWSSFCNWLLQYIFVYPQKVFTQNAVDAWSRLAGLIYYVLYFELVEALFWDGNFYPDFQMVSKAACPLTPSPPLSGGPKLFRIRLRTLYSIKHEGSKCC